MSSRAWSTRSASTCSSSVTAAARSSPSAGGAARWIRCSSNASAAASSSRAITLRLVPASNRLARTRQRQYGSKALPSPGLRTQKPLAEPREGCAKMFRGRTSVRPPSGPTTSAAGMPRAMICTQRVARTGVEDHAKDRFATRPSARVLQVRDWRNVFTVSRLHRSHAAISRSAATAQAACLHALRRATGCVALAPAR